MMWMREIPHVLIMAQLSLETLDGFSFLQTFRWHEQKKKWTLRFRISLPELNRDSDFFASDWYLTVDDFYPLGSIDIYPAKDKGIIGTFPHQSYNHEGEPSLPWRTGKICVNTQAKVIGRHGYDVEPYSVEDRLLWNCQRAIEWVRSASKGELLLPDEPFELPLLPPDCKALLTFHYSEGSIGASTWSNSHFSSGLARCFNLRTNESMWFFEMLTGPNHEYVLEVPWGQYVNHLRGKSWDGLWLRVNDIPLVKPFRFPATWGELTRALSEQDVSLKDIFNFAKHLRDGKIHFLLIGFPIPEYYKGANATMHWLAIGLPVLSRANEYSSGFRANDLGYTENDLRTRFRSDISLVYMLSANWHPEQIQNRGRFHQKLRSSRIAIIGCGALGAPIAELLVRGGIQHMTLFDDESIEIGNLTRHNLSLSDLGNSKAAQLALRLNSLNPQAEVSYVSSKIDFGGGDITNRLIEHELIVDCTGSDELLYVLSEISFSNSVYFISLSIGFRAKRMFFFQARDVSFPVDNYRQAMFSWIETEQEEFRGETFPREGIGCYHPVFPARCDDMWLWASVAVKALSRVVEDSTLIETIFHVYEQNEEEDGSFSIRRVTEAPGYE